MKKLSTIQKIIVICVVVVVITASITLGCLFGIKPTVTLDYGYTSYVGLGSLDDNLTGSRNIKTISSEMRFSSFAPPLPTRIGYSFQGWHKDSALTKAWVNGSDKVKSDITLYAKWELIP